MELIILLVIGVIAGILSGLFGIGGGIFIVPSLMILLNYTQLSSNGTSLAALLLPVGILGAIEYYKQNLINIKVAIFIGLGLSVGIILGSEFAFALPTNILKMSYGFFLIYISFRFLGIFKYIISKLKKSKEKKSVTKIEISIPISLMTGFIAGIMAGLFGLGGGLIIVPILISVFHFDTKMATATSLATLLLPVGLPGVILYHQHNHLNFISAVPIALGIIGGTLIGAKLAIGFTSDQMKKAYAIFLLIVAFYFIFSV